MLDVSGCGGTCEVPIDKCLISFLASVGIQRHALRPSTKHYCSASQRSREILTDRLAKQFT